MHERKSKMQKTKKEKDPFHQICQTEGTAEDIDIF